MIDSLLFLLIGILLGIITGLIPGIHTNLIAVIAISIPILSAQNPTNIIILLVSTAITHTFLNFIPSIFIGAPDEDSFLGVLPGHRFLMRGLGFHAMKLTIVGSTIATISLIVIIPIFIFLIPKIYPTIEQMMGFILIWAVIFLLKDEKEKIISSLIFIFSGLLGITTFNLGIKNPILPMLSGLFGISSIYYSIKNNSNPPEQILTKRKLSKKEIIKPAVATIFISPICSLLPGLGSSQAASISSSFFKKLKEDQFMILLGSINTLVTLTSFLTLYLFQKSRTGVANAIAQIAQITPQNLILIFVIAIISSTISIPIALIISKTIAKKIDKINYRKISIFVILLLIIVTGIFSGILGILVLFISTSLGIFCNETKVKKSFLMGCILIPAIIYYLPFN